MRQPYLDVMAALVQPYLDAIDHAAEASGSDSDDDVDEENVDEEIEVVEVVAKTRAPRTHHSHKKDDVKATRVVAEKKRKVDEAELDQFRKWKADQAKSAKKVEQAKSANEPAPDNLLGASTVSESMAHKGWPPQNIQQPAENNYIQQTPSTVSLGQTQPSAGGYQGYTSLQQWQPVQIQAPLRRFVQPPAIASMLLQNHMALSRERFHSAELRRLEQELVESKMTNMATRYRVKKTHI